jgi:serine/threonine protein kinase
MRWMAPESLRKGIFSEKSDVWSFAVTAWEVLNQGSTPYGRSVKTLDVGRQVLKGFRLSYPDTLEVSLEELFLKCMAAKPADRPAFADVVTQLDLAEGAEIVYASLATFGTLDGGTAGNGNDLAEFRSGL